MLQLLKLKTHAVHTIIIRLKLTLKPMKGKIKLELVNQQKLKQENPLCKWNFQKINQSEVNNKNNNDNKI